MKFYDFFKRQEGKAEQEKDYSLVIHEVQFHVWCIKPAYIQSQIIRALCASVVFTTDEVEQSCILLYDFFRIEE